jgi:hypothetical protein
MLLADLKVRAKSAARYVRMRRISIKLANRSFKLKKTGISPKKEKTLF